MIANDMRRERKRKIAPCDLGSCLCSDLASQPMSKVAVIAIAAGVALGLIMIAVAIAMWSIVQ